MILGRRGVIFKEALWAAHPITEPSEAGVVVEGVEAGHERLGGLVEILHIFCPANPSGHSGHVSASARGICVDDGVEIGFFKTVSHVGGPVHLGGVEGGGVDETGARVEEGEEGVVADLGVKGVRV